MARLVAAGDVARSRPSPTRRRPTPKPSASLSSSARSNGVVHEPGPGDRSHQRVQLAHHRLTCRRRRARALPRTRPTRGTDGTRGTGSTAPVDRSGAVALHQPQRVVAVGVGGVGTPPGEGRGDVDGRAADAALPAGDQRPAPRRPQPAATRALNSVIISSHTGSRRRRPCQNDCWRRASNSSNGVPCCSTHV